MNKEYKLILLDLDDTMFDELQYVKSGFVSVAKYISRNSNFTQDIILSQMMYQFYKYGRNGIFNRVTSYFKLGSMSIPDIVNIYRNHDPEIELLAGVTEACADIESIVPIVIITDGLSSVQRKKVAALGIDIPVLYCMDFNSPKPAVNAYSHALKMLSIRPEDALVIGDDPYCDIVAAHNLGSDSCRIISGKYSSIPCLDDYKSTYEFDSFVSVAKFLLEEYT